MLNFGKITFLLFFQNSEITLKCSCMQLLQAKGSMVIKHTFVPQERSPQPPASTRFHYVTLTVLLSVLKNSYDFFPLWLWYRNFWLSQNHHTPWKVCYYISQPTCLVQMPVARWGDVSEDKTLVQPFTPGSWVKSRNSHSISLSSKCGLAESTCVRPLEQEQLEDNLTFSWRPHQSPAGSQNWHINHFYCKT